MKNAERAWIRCMGGRFCQHTPGTCTADPEYQAAIASNPTITETETVADFVPCERTVRLVCDWFEAEFPHSPGPDKARKLFMKPARADELVRAFHEFDDADGLSPHNLPRRLVDWLIAQGEIKP